MHGLDSPIDGDLDALEELLKFSIFGMEIALDNIVQSLSTPHLYDTRRRIKRTGRAAI